MYKRQGCLVNFKTEKLSYKVKHSVENPPEKQVIFENHHEPIIDTQTWERVQELRKQRKRPNRYDEVGLFSGILFCADCGSVMYQQRYQTDKRKQDCYICGNYKKRTHDCTAHFIRTDLLTAGVLSNLRKVTSYAAKHEARFMKLLIEMCIRDSQALICTHPDGHNHSGNIHVHIVINSLRIYEVPLLPYMDRPADTREGCKHRCTCLLYTSRCV